MGIGLRHTILLMLVASFAAVYIPHASCSCSGPCVVGGSSSYDFMGDPAVNLDMSRPDEFIRESLGSGKTSLSVKALSQANLSITNSSLNQTNKGNLNQNSSLVNCMVNTTGNTATDNTTSNRPIVKIGASGMQDKRLLTLALNTFNNNML